LRSSYEGNGRLSIALAMSSASYSFIGARRVLDFELLGQEGGADAGEGRRIFVATTSQF